jgi:predicted AlkP superfamily pyrophosphatase or phosphodiesterase
MLNAESITTVDQSCFGKYFTKPLYDGYAFAQIPNTLRSLLTGGTYRGIPFAGRSDLIDRYDTVILFFIDAFGWRFISRYSDHPFLKRISETGLINKLTSQFPSTTAAHVTTIHTGLPVGESGVYEWFYYEPQLDAMISPLLYSFAGDEERDTLKSSGIDAHQLFPTRTIYQQLADHGVRSFIIQDHRYTFSPYTQVVTDGATLVPYRTFPEALASLYEHMQIQEQPTYYFLYYDRIDSVCHQHGPNSLQLEAEIQVFLDTMESIFEREMSRVNGKTLFLMTADHAQVEIDPATTFYLNSEIPELLPLLRCNRAGKILAPGGSPRDIFLYVKPGELEATVGLLKHHLKSRAEICATAELLKSGFFGSSPPSKTFLDRLADLVILPYAHESVWWYEKGKFEQTYYGSHGGLTPAEMETVLLVQRYGA